MNMVPAFVDTTVCLAASCKPPLHINKNVFGLPHMIQQRSSFHYITTIYSILQVITNKWVLSGGKIISTAFWVAPHDTH